MLCVVQNLSLLLRLLADGKNAISDSQYMLFTLPVKLLI